MNLYWLLLKNKWSPNSKSSVTYVCPTVQAWDGLITTFS